MSKMTTARHGTRVAAKVRRRAVTALRALRRQYRFSRLGNQRNPLDELFFILLTGNTTDGPARAAFDRLRARFRPWTTLLDATEDEIAGQIIEAGLYRQRAVAIKQIAQALEKRFGAVTLAPLRRMEREDAETFLVSLPRVGIKSARCVLGYSLGHDTMPVDTHCRRIMHRLGLVDVRSDSRRLHDEAEGVFPAGQRLRAHVAMVLHGRTRCHEVRPRCVGCPVKRHCIYPAQNQRRAVA